MKLFAIFGDPVSHSRSPLMHNSVFTQLNYPACYTRIHLRDGTQLKQVFLDAKLSGANITVPHKEVAYEACDEIRGFAKKVGVVNTIINENGRLIGYNTDADGFLYAIRDFTNIQKVLILGAGGTAKALAQRFLEKNFEVSLLNRSEARLHYFQERNVNTATWENFTPSSYDLVVNTTSAGLKDEMLPAPKELIETILQHSRYAADAIYGKLTPFLQLAQIHNTPFIDGADMLLGQGVLANELFVANQLPKEKITQAMQKSFLL